MSDFAWELKYAPFCFIPDFYTFSAMFVKSVLLK